MNHDAIVCKCPLKGDIYKAPEQHAPWCPVYLHMEQVVAGTCKDCNSVDESEGAR